MVRSQRETALANGWRSGLEERVAASLQARGAVFEYETLKLQYILPEKTRTYHPDFIITTKSGKTIIVETKGRWLVADRQKMKCVVEQNAGLDIRLVFQNPNQLISKTSKTTYAAWCQKYLEIPFAVKDVPTSWLLE